MWAQDNNRLIAAVWWWIPLSNSWMWWRNICTADLTTPPTHPLAGTVPMNKDAQRYMSKKARIDRTGYYHEGFLYTWPYHLQTMNNYLFILINKFILWWRGAAERGSPQLSCSLHSCKKKQRHGCENKRSVSQWNSTPLLMAFFFCIIACLLRQNMCSQRLQIL